MADEMIDRWFKWVDEAESVPDDQHVALSNRNLIVRRAIAERHPDNQITVRLF
ncbi:hypothetical protein [Nostoc sp. JL33]|uniref:hypothetical protein n=1 Tax=Nostoc sp. JL33 TaxID=2815396 RepID=UPI0034389F17